MVSARYFSFWKTAPWFHWHSEELKWKVSQQLQDPAGQSSGPSGVFWSSHISPCRGQRPATTKVLVLGRNLWSGLWCATVSDGGTRSASFLPGTLETSAQREEDRPSQLTEGRFNLWISIKITIYMCVCRWAISLGSLSGAIWWGNRSTDNKSNVSLQNVTLNSHSRYSFKMAVTHRWGKKLTLIWLIKPPQTQFQKQKDTRMQLGLPSVFCWWRWNVS